MSPGCEIQKAAVANCWGVENGCGQFSGVCRDVVDGEQGIVADGRHMVDRGVDVAGVCRNVVDGNKAFTTGNGDVVDTGIHGAPAYQSGE